MSTPVDPQLHDDACTHRVLIFVKSFSSHLIFACIIFLLVSASASASAPVYLNLHRWRM
jgi:hypothetical protein